MTVHHYWLGMAVAEEAQYASTFKQPFMARRLRKEWERALALDPNHKPSRPHRTRRMATLRWRTRTPGPAGRRRR